MGRIAIEEVSVRSPEVFVRPLAHEEALRLKRMAKRSEHSSTRQRAAILLGSNASRQLPKLAACFCRFPAALCSSYALAASERS